MADENGYRATIKTNEPGTANKDPASTYITALDPPAQTNPARCTAAAPLVAAPRYATAPVARIVAAPQYAPTPQRFVAAPTYAPAPQRLVAAPAYAPARIVASPAYAAPQPARIVAAPRYAPESARLVAVQEEPQYAQPAQLLAEPAELAAYAPRRAYKREARKAAKRSYSAAYQGEVAQESAVAGVVYADIE